MKKLNLNISLRGSSLLYSLMISLLVSALLSAYLMTDFSLRTLVSREYGESRAHDNLRSAVAAAVSSMKYGEIHDFGWASDSDTMNVVFSNWGAFKLMYARGSYLNYRSGLSALLGQRGPEEREALILSDEGNPLILQGNSQIRGKVRVPKGLIQTERYLGKAFSGSLPLNEYRFASQKLGDEDFPDIPMEMDRQLDSLLKVRKTSVLPLAMREQIHQPWQGVTRNVRVNGKLQIKSGEYSGRQMFLATEAIEVYAEANLEDVILIAPKIVLRAGVKGRMQAFASDSLLVGEDVKLQFPSILALQTKSNQQAFLQIGTGCRIEGAVLFNQPIFSTYLTSSNLRPQVFVAKGSHIYGTMHVAGNLELHGVVGGMVIAQGFVLRTAVGTVRNHLLNAQLLVDRLAPAYAGPFFYASSGASVLQYYPNDDQAIASTRK